MDKRIILYEIKNEKVNSSLRIEMNEEKEKSVFLMLPTMGWAVTVNGTEDEILQEQVISLKRALKGITWERSTGIAIQWMLSIIEPKQMSLF